jgi:hypothetical protein
MAPTRQKRGKRCKLRFPVIIEKHEEEKTDAHAEKRRE